MAKVYRSICMEIDDLLLKIMRLSEQLIECKLQIETVMNNGFVNIAKARYIMGSKCVSTLQLPTKQSNPIHPLATVCRTKCDGFWVFEQQRAKLSSPAPDKKLTDEKMGSEAARTVVKDLQDEGSKGIRKRKDISSVEDSNPNANYKIQNEVLTDSSKSASSLIGISDPIRLFGVLVPYTLRTAQKDFQEVINLLMHCATLQSETNQVLDRYNHLMNVKNLIIKAAKNVEFDLSNELEYWTQSKESLKISDTSTRSAETKSELQMKEEHEPERSEDLITETEELIGSVKRFEILGSHNESTDKECEDESERDSNYN